MAGVLVAARMEAGNQRQGEKHIRKLEFTGNGPQAHIGGEPRTTRDKKRKIMRGQQKVWRKSKDYGVSKRSQPRREAEDRKRQKEKQEPETNEKQNGEDRGRSEEKQRTECEKVKGKAILTKETGGGAGRKSFPHQHILFQKSSKLCWNESERITESQPANRKEKRRGSKKKI